MLCYFIAKKSNKKGGPWTVISAQAGFALVFWSHTKLVELFMVQILLLDWRCLKNHCVTILNP